VGRSKSSAHKLAKQWVPHAGSGHLAQPRPQMVQPGDLCLTPDTPKPRHDQPMLYLCPLDVG
jgi:hypothetical protein